VQLPSVALSQKQELAVWTPAPFFWTTTQVTMGEKENIKHFRTHRQIPEEKKRNKVLDKVKYNIMLGT